LSCFNKGNLLTYLLSSNNGVLSNGCAIRYINAFPYYRSTSKGAHYFHRVVDLVVINIDLWDTPLGHTHDVVRAERIRFSLLEYSILSSNGRFAVYLPGTAAACSPALGSHSS